MSAAAGMCVLAGMRVDAQLRVVNGVFSASVHLFEDRNSAPSSVDAACRVVLPRSGTWRSSLAT